MYEVILLLEAERFFGQAQHPFARKLAKCFQYLERDPHHHPNSKPLAGALAGYYRFRAGNHRVIYRIDEEDRIVWVEKIAHRREAYR